MSPQQLWGFLLCAELMSPMKETDMKYRSSVKVGDEDSYKQSEECKQYSRGNKCFCVNQSFSLLLGSHALGITGTTERSETESNHRPRRNDSAQAPISSKVLHTSANAAAQLHIPAILSCQLRNRLKVSFISLCRDFSLFYQKGNGRHLPSGLAFPL